MKFRKKIIIIFFVFFCFKIKAQVQNVNGVVYDISSLIPIDSAEIVFWEKNNSYTAITDKNGYFKIKGVGLGNYSIIVSKEEYYFFQQTSIEVNSGLEVTLDIPMKERIVSLKEIEIKSKYSTPSESNAYLQYIEVEAMERYSGTANNPLNFLKNIAAVKTISEKRGLISVRGNSPFGILYKIENMPVIPPLHFANIGVTGSPVSMLNINYLNNFDFLIGSFESNNGNALAGIADISFKKIISDKTQGTFGTTFNGFELGVEGKFSKKSRATYLVNYRYSFLDLVNKVLGIFGGALDGTVPEYQDATFKVNLPYSLKGNVSVWGIIGPSKIVLKDNIQVPSDFKDKLGNEDKTKTEFTLTYLTGIFGVNLQHRFNDKFHGKFFTGTSLYEYEGTRNVLFENNPTRRLINFKYNVNVVNVGADLSYKINEKNDILFGVASDINFFGIKGKITPFLKSYSGIDPITGKSFSVDINTEINYLEGLTTTSLLKAYANHKHYFTKDFTLNSGVYGQIFLLNNSFSIEPRVSAQYTLKEKNIFSITAGLHSQTQPLDYYFTKSDDEGKSNIETLQLNKSVQTSVNYRRVINDHLNLSASVYYQYHFDIAGDDDDKSFSVLNTGSDWFFQPKFKLNNKGLGQNYGGEIDIKLNNLKGFYGTLAASVFSSTYAGTDGVWRSTFYDLGQSVNLNVGYELKLNKKIRFFVNTKFAYAGGNLITPYNIEYSKAKPSLFNIKTLKDKAFTERLPDYITWNINIGFVVNHKKVSQRFMVDFQNVTNNTNVYGKSFNPYTLETFYEEQFTIKIPVFYYRINF